jgi:DNA mismatch endonuclease (patch repair protein)
MDVLTKAERSKQMSLVRSKDTKPELLVRRLVHRLGFRYSLHKGDLPGKPDLVFPSRKRIIFVHGCFWHAHDCRLGRMPKSRLRYWTPKIERNSIRDALTLRRLRGMRWRCLVLWECQLRDLDALSARVERFLREPRQ